MARKKSLGFPHYMEIFKLVMAFSVLIIVFGISFAYMFDVGSLRRADAARGGSKGPNATKPVAPVACADIYQPVCGTDGKTYSNECYATRIGNVEVAYEGECNGDNTGGAPVIYY